MNFEKKPGHPDVYLLPAISQGCVLFPYRMVLIHPQASPGGLFRLWPHPSSSLPITKDNDSAPNSSVVVWVFSPPSNSQDTTTQLSPDTVYPEPASDSTGQELGPTRLPPTPTPSDANFISRLSPMCLTNWLQIQQPLPWVQRVTHRTQRHILFTRL